MKRFIAVVAIVAAVGLSFSDPARTQGKKGTITGTVIDTYCLVTMNMGGPAHKQCAATCAKNGSPLGIKEDKTESVYLVAGQKKMLYSSKSISSPCST